MRREPRLQVSVLSTLTFLRGSLLETNNQRFGNAPKRQTNLPIEAGNHEEPFLVSVFHLSYRDHRFGRRMDGAAGFRTLQPFQMVSHDLLSGTLTDRPEQRGSNEEFRQRAR